MEHITIIMDNKMKKELKNFCSTLDMPVSIFVRQVIRNALKGGKNG